MPSSAFIGTEARQIYGSSFRVQKGKALGARDPRPGRTTYFVGLLTVPERTTVALRLGENRSLQRRGDEEKGRSSSGFQIKRGRKRTLHRRLLPPAIPKKIASARVQRRPSFLRAGYSPVQPFRTTLDGIRRLSGRSFGSLRFLGYDSGRDVLHKNSHTKNSSVFFGHRWNKLVAFRPQNPKNS